MRALPFVLLLAAACGGKPSGAGPEGRPEDVAKALFEALKGGGAGPIETHLMTPEEAKKVTGVALDPSGELERWEHRIVQHHERLDVDWATAVMDAARVKMDPMGGRAHVGLEIDSERGTVLLDVEVMKVGRRYVLDDVKVARETPSKQAAPEGEEDGSGD